MLTRQNSIGPENQKVEAILKNPKRREHFKKFMEANFCGENVDFWYEVEQFKNISPELVNVIKGRANMICKRYFSKSAEKELNVPALYVKDIEEARQNPHPEMFRTAQQYIVAMMAMDKFPKYKETLKKPLQITVVNQEYESLQTPRECNFMVTLDLHAKDVYDKIIKKANLNEKDGQSYELVSEKTGSVLPLQSILLEGDISETHNKIIFRRKSV